MAQLNQYFRKDPSIVYREIAGESILVPIRPSVDDLDSIYTLNETGAYIWSLLDGERTLEDISKAVVQEFETDEGQAKQDLFELIDDLETIGAVVKV